MSVLLGLFFVCSGTLAVAVIALSWHRYAPLIHILGAELRKAPGVQEMRLSVKQHVLLRLRPNRPLRHAQRRKPTRHRLRGRLRRRAVA
jgi:hypothetical protein